MKKRLAGNGKKEEEIERKLEHANHVLTKGRLAKNPTSTVGEEGKSKEREGKGKVEGYVALLIALSKDPGDDFEDGKVCSAKNEETEQGKRRHLGEEKTTQIGKSCSSLGSRKGPPSCLTAGPKKSGRRKELLPHHPGEVQILKSKVLACAYKDCNLSGLKSITTGEEKGGEIYSNQTE